MVSLEASILRGQATRDAQSAIAPTWLWDEKSIAQWIADLIAMHTKQVVVSDLEADSLARRATYENGIVLLHDRTVEGLGMGRVKWRKDEAKKHILSTLSASGGSRETVQTEAQAWESVWEKFDAAWSPSPLNTLAGFRTLITDSNAQEDLYKKAHTDWRTSAEELAVASVTLWEESVAWYEAATTLFKQGTAIGDMIRSTIPTSPTTPLPTPVELATATAVAGSLLATTYVAGGGAHATVTVLEWKIVGVDADFGHDTPVNAAGQTVATGGAVGAVVQVRVRTTNSTGTTFSTVKTVTLV